MLRATPADPSKSRALSAGMPAWGPPIIAASSATPSAGEAWRGISSFPAPESLRDAGSLGVPLPLRLWVGPPA
eukprot:11171231-Lingulodinium_polyedra.AAC.1